MHAFSLLAAITARQQALPALLPDMPAKPDPSESQTIQLMLGKRNTRPICLECSMQELDCHAPAPLGQLASGLITTC